MPHSSLDILPLLFKKADNRSSIIHLFYLHVLSNNNPCKAHYMSHLPHHLSIEKKERQHHKMSHSKPYSKPPSRLRPTWCNPFPFSPILFSGTSLPSRQEYRKHKKQTHATVSQPSASYALPLSPPPSPTRHHLPSTIPSDQLTEDHYTLYYTNNVHQALRNLRNKCAFCLCEQEGSAFATHATKNCLMNTQASWLTFRNSGLAYPTGTCFFCSLPQVRPLFFFCFFFFFLKKTCF